MCLHWATAGGTKVASGVTAVAWLGTRRQVPVQRSLRMKASMSSPVMHLLRWWLRLVVKLLLLPFLWMLLVLLLHSKVVCLHCCQWIFSTTTTTTTEGLPAAPTLHVTALVVPALVANALGSETLGAASAGATILGVVARLARARLQRPPHGGAVAVTGLVGGDEPPKLRLALFDNLPHSKQKSLVVHPFCCQDYERMMIRWNLLAAALRGNLRLNFRPELHCLPFDLKGKAG